MNRFSAAILLCAVVWLLPANMAPPATSTLSARITGLAPARGQVLVSLYNTADGFPSNSAKALRTVVLPVTSNTAVAQFKDLPPGTYAVAFIHDLDGDGKLGTNFLGIPVEGYGASNNATGTFGPPSWQDARFTVATPGKEIAMKVRY